MNYEFRSTDDMKTKVFVLINDILIQKDRHFLLPLSYLWFVTPLFLKELNLE